MTTGEKIRYYRNLRGMSQETLGELSGIHYATIKKYELGIRNPKPEQLLKISNALGISINVFWIWIYPLFQMFSLYCLKWMMKLI